MKDKKVHGRENDSVEVVKEVEKSEVALREEEVQAFWEENDIFNKSVEKPAGESPKGDYIFYDGPPFATGLPHYGHIVPGTIKDAIPRFWTMNGYRVRRQWGWDCHGLPLENLIEKKLGLANKKDIEDYGIKNFNEAAREAVLEYADDWRQIIPRLGRFVDMENDYKTMDSNYTESVWWVFKQLHEKGLVYEGFKSMHLCPRCGTTLSNFEVNQGYKDVKDIAVTVKMPLLDENGNKTDTSILIWTTTPWTLPGNMAIAVNQELDYVKVSVLNSTIPDRVGADGEIKKEIKYENVILAKGRLAQLGDLPYEVVEEMKGSDLLDLSYEPPFNYFENLWATPRGPKRIDDFNEEKEKEKKAWKIYHADFVEIGEEGTGVVHLAPAYGEDDMNVAKENNIPIAHHVDYGGRFMDFVTDFAGQLVKPKDDDEARVSHLDADIEVLRHLQTAGKIFKKENITHSYPHCWRDSTPLLNYATTSWFVKVTDMRDELVAANNKVKWVPDYVGQNRFGKWLEGARDWAVSRQRYWGAPLPIWKNEKTGEYKVFGSMAEMQEFVPKSGNKYFITRHAESALNTKETLNVDVAVENGITDKGKEQVSELVEKLKAEKIDLIYYSPLQRTKETAEKVAEGLGLSKEVLVADERLLEVRFGEFDGKTVSEYHAFFTTGTDRLTKTPEGGENWTDVKRRAGELLNEIETKHKDKNVLFVSHNGTLQMLQAVAKGDDFETLGKIIEENTYDLNNAELRALPFVPFPHNDSYELDYHRPYIDDIKLYEDGEELKRVPDVFDCWFESGSVPYGQLHYPFENKEKFEAERFPAQFIAEGLDQTRGWFYSMLVLGVALFGKSPYENVIVNGLVLAEDGKKMSKSLQNYPDPMELVGRLGADSMRYYLLSSPVVHSEDLSFAEKDVLEIQRKNIGRLHNVLAMYEMFADGGEEARGASEPRHDSNNVLDRWIVARLNQLIAESTAGYKAYELDKAVRPITDFIDDLSVWYLRRSRDRLKGEDVEDKKLALGTLRYVLRELAKVMAPAMPFYAEYLYRAVRDESEAESVHLAKWPETGSVNEVLLDCMRTTRELVTLALEQRTRSGIKVRQPLSSLSVSKPVDSELLSVIADEVNVKTVTVNETQSEVVVLDTNITTELKQEGEARELIRVIQDMRKESGLKPQDVITLTIATSPAGEEMVKAQLDIIKKVVGAKEITFTTTKGKEIQIGDNSYLISIVKV
ncbi:MAG: class I tRNA ligase family protein [Candidatus Nomurabacteria bacterium]|nr:class I tRNA ligase family protein [Candidatus Nomurabacteria bacterium]USN88206.1 MAG: class I tRNA ligase family protein [Candidatus Nomurabacteria bacterium]